MGDYTVEEVTAACHILARVHTLLLSKMGTGEGEVLSPHHVFAGDPAENYANGHTDGFEKGIKCFPESIDEVSLEELLAAVYGEDEVTRANVL